jgi:hypothetical protein
MVVHLLLVGVSQPLYKGPEIPWRRIITKCAARKMNAKTGRASIWIP